MSLQQSIALALRNNPSSAVALHSELSARQNFLSQGSPANPTLAYSGLNNSVAPFGGFSDSSNYAFYLTLETSGRWRYRSDQARWEYVAARETTLGARFGLVQTVTSAYIGLQVAKADLDAEQQTWNDAKKLTDLTEQQFKLGAAPETNSIRAQIALKQEDQNLIRAKSALALARQVLDNALGIDPSSPVDSADPLRYSPAALDRANLIRLALANRFELHVGTATEKSLRSAIGLNRSNYLPDVLLGTTLQGQSIEIGLTIPIDLGSIRSSVSKAREDLKVQEALNEKQRQQVLLDVETAFENLIRAQKVVDSYRTDEVPQAESLLQKIQAGYALGASTILDVLDAEATVRTARTGLNDSIGAYQNALSQLQIAVGLPLDQIRSNSLNPAGK